MFRQAKPIDSLLRHALLFMGMLLFVIGNLSHIHLSYCLDGEQAPVSFHFEPDNAHHGNLMVEASSNPENGDVERELSLVTLVAKIFKSPSDTAAITAYHFPALVFEIPRVNWSLGNTPRPVRPTAQLPLPRAPPALV